MSTMGLRYPRVKREGEDERKREEKEKKKRGMYKTAMRKRATRGREREAYTSNSWMVCRSSKGSFGMSCTKQVRVWKSEGDENQEQEKKR